MRFLDDRSLSVVAFENIKEIRSGPETRYYREQFQCPPDYEERWITIIYITDSNYKTLHIVANTKDAFNCWDSTLRSLYAVRKDLMSGLGHIEKRQLVWERRYWKGADDSGDEKLNFEEIEHMCMRLNIRFSKDELRNRFNAADSKGTGNLEFADFQKFVKGLKARPELEGLYGRLIGESGRGFGFEVFEKFMREEQKVSSDLYGARLFVNDDGELVDAGKS